VIEAAGAQHTLDLAGALVAVRGRLVIPAYHQDSGVNMQLWNWRGIDVINAHERDRRKYTHGMAAAAQAVAESALNPAFLYTHGYSLEDAAQAFAALESRPDGFLKAWIGAQQ
jgi:threonine dehydrogenase-like Zn-dependent dehydrogenase